MAALTVTGRAFAQAAVVVALVLAGAWVLPVKDAGAVSAGDKTVTIAVLKAVERRSSKRANERVSRIQDPDLALVLRWMVYQFTPANAPLADLMAFMDANDDLPARDKLQASIEGRVDASLPLAERLAWFDAHPPQTTIGRMRHLEALTTRDGSVEHAAEIRATWITGRFTKAEERRFLARYRVHIRESDHARRLERVLWEGPRSAARRAMYRARGDERLLAEARYLLRYNRGNVDRAIAKVPARLRNHPGLVFERMRWRRKRGREAQAFKLMPDVPGATLPYPEVWWAERAVLSRWALREGRITDAYRTASQHGLEPGGTAYAEAEWFAGWVALRFLNDAETALGHFKAMGDAVSTPVSLARAEYWAGRAAEALNDPASAKQHFEAAARHPTVYYGQLAHERLDRPGGLRLPEMPIIGDAAIAAFRARPMIRGLEKLAAITSDEVSLRRLFIGLADLDPSAENVTLLAALARRIGRTDLSVAVAKRALREGVVLPLAGWPMLQPPPYPRHADDPTMLEAPLVLSVIRQESLFRTGAVSHAGARGLMQLMPATARRVAKTSGKRYIRSKLTTDPSYNMILGQRYLDGLIDDFDGSYILALAGYNAGPSRSRAWIRAFGDPRDPDVDPVDWVEHIPFRETRNYVQRIMENLQVYRALWSGTDVASALESDLERSGN